MPLSAQAKAMAASLGYQTVKPKPVVVGPQNVGLPGYRPGDPNPGGGPGTVPALPGPAYGTPGNPQPAAPAAPAAPAPVDFWSQALTDPQYITGADDLQRQHDAAIASLTNQWKQTGQSYQDNANARGALFSGAAVHANNYNDQRFGDQSAVLTQNLFSGQHQLQTNVFTRLLQQLAGGGA